MPVVLQQERGQYPQQAQDIAPPETVVIDEGNRPATSSKPSLDAKSRILGDYSRDTDALAGKLSPEGDVETVRAGLGRITAGVSKTAAAVLMTSVLAMGAEKPGQQTRPQPASVSAPSAQTAQSRNAPMEPSKERLGSVAKQMGGANFETGPGSENKLWGLLPEGERRWWTERSAAENKGAKGQDVEERARNEAYMNYQRWCLADAGNTQGLMGITSKAEAQFFRRANRPNVPVAKEGASQDEVRAAVRAYENYAVDEFKHMEKGITEHYAGMGLMPHLPSNPEEVGKTVGDEVRTRFESTEKAKALIKGFKPVSDSDKELKAKAEETLLRHMFDLTSKDRYMKLIPLEGMGKEQTEACTKAANEAYEREMISVLKTMPGGGRRVEIFRKYGLAVTDGAVSMSPEFVDVTGKVLENTPAHLRSPKILGGGLIMDTTRPRDLNEKTGLETIASYERDLKGIRNLSESGPNHIHHELGHGVHFSILTEDKFVEFASLGGWRYKDLLTDKPVEIPAGTGEVFNSDNVFWQKPPQSTVVREYSRTNPMEDFATLYEEYTGDTRKLLEKAVFQYKENNDKTLMHKVGWMMDNVFKDPETGEVYVYREGGMGKEKSGYDYIQRNLGELGLGTAEPAKDRAKKEGGGSIE